jgi:hypothetical protein
VGLGPTRFQFELLAYFGWLEGSRWPKGATGENMQVLRRRGWLRPVGRSRTVFELTRVGEQALLDYWRDVLKQAAPPRRQNGPDALDKRLPGSYGSRKGY